MRRASGVGVGAGVRRGKTRGINNIDHSLYTSNIIKLKYLFIYNIRFI
jgi:hypothetical protein